MSMKKIIIAVGLITLMAANGCQRIEGRKETDGSITFEPGEFEPWTNGYENGITITIEPVQ